MDRRAMKNVMLGAAMALVAFSGFVAAQTGAAPAPAAPLQEQADQAAGAAAVGDGLSDLSAVTFSCPRAGLNAAAREAAKVPSQGTYQFAFFRIINDSHHASYEVHFKSNYAGEADLKYCVALYCQQGWDPRTTKTSVTLMPNQRQRTRDAAHDAECGHTAAPGNRRLK